MYCLLKSLIACYVDLVVIIGAARISRLLFLSCTCLEGLIDLADIVEICDIVKIRRRNVPAAHFYAGPNLNYRYGEADPFQSFSPSDSKSHQDVVVFVSEFAGFLGVSLVTV